MTIAHAHTHTRSGVGRTGATGGTEALQSFAPTQTQIQRSTPKAPTNLEGARAKPLPSKCKYSPITAQIVRNALQVYLPRAAAIVSLRSHALRCWRTLCPPRLVTKPLSGGGWFTWLLTLTGRSHWNFTPWVHPQKPGRQWRALGDRGHEARSGLDHAPGTTPDDRSCLGRTVRECVTARKCKVPELRQVWTVSCTDSTVCTL